MYCLLGAQKCIIEIFRYVLKYILVVYIDFDSYFITMGIDTSWY